VKLTPALYREVRAILAAMGHVGDWEWSQALRPPTDERALLCEYTWVVLNSGMKNTVARKIMDRVWPLLSSGQAISGAFGHKGKVSALEDTWARRYQRFNEFRDIGIAGFERYDSAVQVAKILGWCRSLPWIGEITKYHLAKNLGVDVAKPDRWLVRLADAEGETVDGLCARLAAATGDRVATVDVVLWRACAVGLLTIDARGIELREVPASELAGVEP
jgi:hypothetical protein